MVFFSIFLYNNSAPGTSFSVSFIEKFGIIVNICLKISSKHLNARAVSWCRLSFRSQIKRSIVKKSTIPLLTFVTGNFYVTTGNSGSGNTLLTTTDRTVNVATRTLLFIMEKWSLLPENKNKTMQSLYSNIKTKSKRILFESSQVI